MFRGSTSADNKILETVTRRLQRSSVSQLGLTASVNRGTVAITGLLQYEGQRNAIIKSIRTISGVRQVLDRLQIPPGAQDRSQVTADQNTQIETN